MQYNMVNGQLKLLELIWSWTVGFYQIMSIAFINPKKLFNFGLLMEIKLYLYLIRVSGEFAVFSEK